MEQPRGVQVQTSAIINKLANQVSQQAVQIAQLQAANEALMQQLAEANKKTEEETK